MTSGVFFDVDGTLIDNVYFHVVAWLRACRECSIPAHAAQLHKLIGMGGDRIVQTLVGRAMPELDEAHSRYMQPYEEEGKPFGGARELLLELRRRGHHLAVSTSGGAGPAEASLRRILPDISAIDNLVTRDDIKSTKPAPDLVAVALQRSGLDPRDVIYVGDTNWDVEAAARCDVRTIGVTSGGWTEQELLDAGAVTVYGTVGDLLEQLSESPLAALPAPLAP